MKFPHTHFSRGKRLRIVLRDGSVLFGKFYERHATSMEVSTDGGNIRIPTKSLRNVTIWKRG